MCGPFIQLVVVWERRGGNLYDIPGGKSVSTENQEGRYLGGRKLRRYLMIM